MWSYRDAVFGEVLSKRSRMGAWLIFEIERKRNKSERERVKISGVRLATLQYANVVALPPWAAFQVLLYMQQVLWREWIYVAWLILSCSSPTPLPYQSQHWIFLNLINFEYPVTQKIGVSSHALAHLIHENIQPHFKSTLRCNNVLMLPLLRKHCCQPAKNSNY